MMKIEDFDYNLPADLIADSPVSPRDASRLLVFNSRNFGMTDKFFYDLRDFVESGDLIITNNSRVMPARIFGKKLSGGKIEMLLLEKCDQNWQVLIGGKVKIGDEINFGPSLNGKILARDGKESIVNFNLSGNDFWRVVEEIGKTPIPPYIKHSELAEEDLKREYQTVYAKSYGSAAAPTAGLHFSQELIGDLQSSGVNFASIDLHVGLGTFSPISDADIKNKKLHLENFSIPSSTIEKIISTKKAGGKIIAIGTTTVRALESSASRILPTSNCQRQTIFGSTDIFIQPGDKFKIIDGLITNFHLPKSSLMMLVAAFIESKRDCDGREKLLECYKCAIASKYRFYSFGDAMLII